MNVNTNIIFDNTNTISDKINIGDDKANIVDEKTNIGFDKTIVSSDINNKEFIKHRAFYYLHEMLLKINKCTPNF